MLQIIFQEILTYRNPSLNCGDSFPVSRALTIQTNSEKIKREREINFIEVSELPKDTTHQSIRKYIGHLKFQ